MRYMSRIASIWRAVRATPRGPAVLSSYREAYQTELFPAPPARRLGVSYCQKLKNEGKFGRDREKSEVQPPPPKMRSEAFFSRKKSPRLGRAKP